MSGFGHATRSMLEERRELERSWDSTSGHWSDARRDEFEGVIVFPLVRAASETLRDLEAISSIVQRALSML